MRIRIFLVVALFACAGTAALADGFLSLVEYSSAHDFDCAVVYSGTIRTLELGLVEPVNPSFGDVGERAVTSVGGFECKLIPHEGVTILGVAFPVAAIALDINGGMSVGFSEPVPVATNDKTVLATVVVQFSDETSFSLPQEPTLPCYLEYNTWIQITETNPASIAGSVSFLDADDPDDPLVAATCNEGPDYRFDLLMALVDDQTSSWGAVKSLYR